MKTTFFATAVVLGVSAIVQTDNCSPNLKYCGHSLISKGNYRSQLDQLYQDELSRTITSNDGDVWNGDLVTCIGGRSGLVARLQVRPKGACNDNGNGKNDTCGTGLTDDQVPLVA